MIDWLLTPFRVIKEYFETRRRLKELKQRDPFIYK